MYARILLEEREEKGGALALFHAQGAISGCPHRAQATICMGAPNSCTLMDLSPGGSTFQPEPQYTNKRMRPMQAEQDMSNGEGSVWEVSLSKPKSYVNYS